MASPRTRAAGLALVVVAGGVAGGCGSSGSGGAKSLTGTGRAVLGHLKHLNPTTDAATVKGAIANVNQLQDRIQRMPGVAGVTLNAAARTLRVSFDPSATAAQRAAVEKVLAGH